ncbi:MAG: hypothetical protein WCT16_03805 [Candidatus Buchananbacteria bacterium]
MKLKIILVSGLFLFPALCCAALSPFQTVAIPNVISQPNASFAISSTVPTAPVAVPSSINSAMISDSDINTRVKTVVNGEAAAGAVAPASAPAAVTNNLIAPKPGVINGIVIINPAGGEEYEINGKTASIYFKYFGLDKALEGQLKFQVDLLQDGETLGPVAGMYPYSLNIAKGYESLSYMVGWYTDLTQKKDVQAAPGDNFSLKVRILNGNNVVMSATSNEFSFIASQSVLPPLSLKLSSPNGGEEFIEDAHIVQGSYVYTGLDTNTLGGTYTSRIELWRNGKLLGSLYNTDFSENPWQNTSYFGFVSGVYYDEAAKENIIVNPGSGYKIKVTFFKNKQQIISDESDAPFSFKAGPPYTGTPTAQVLIPKAGEKFIIGQDNRLQVAFSGFNPYDNGKLSYKLYLYKGGQKLGKIGLDWLTDTVNVNKPTEDDYDQFKQYYDENQKKYVEIIPGADYQIGVEVYKYHDLFLTGQNTLNFTIARAGAVVSAISGILGRGDKVVAPTEIKSELYQVMDNEPGIKSITVKNSDQFGLKYQQDAKLLGLIPIKYDLQINADLAERKVTLKKPWWLFLTANGADSVANSSQAALDSLDNISGLSEQNQLMLQTQLDRQQKIIQTLSNIIKKVSSTTEAVTQNLK